MLAYNYKKRLVDSKKHCFFPKNFCFLPPLLTGSITCIQKRVSTPQAEHLTAETPSSDSGEEAEGQGRGRKQCGPPATSCLHQLVLGTPVL